MGIHHAMRSIGAAEKALDYFLARINDERKKPFKKLLSEHGIMLERVAQSRIDIDSARLVVCNAAIAIDNAIQAYGGAGVCQDTPLASMYASGRTMRIVDGPDEVHMLQLGRNENKRAKVVTDKLAKQQAATEALLKKHGLEERDVLQ